MFNEQPQKKNMYQSISSFRGAKSCLMYEDLEPKNYEIELQNEVLKHGRVASMKKIQEMENENHIKKLRTMVDSPECKKDKNTLSVWDQLQIHDAKLYRQEMENKRLMKLKEQADMKDFLQGQINGK